MTLIFNRLLEVVQIHVMHPQVVAVSCTKKHKNHVTLTFDLEIKYACRGCQGTCSCIRG